MTHRWTLLWGHNPKDAWLVLCRDGEPLSAFHPAGGSMSAQRDTFAIWGDGPALAEYNVELVGEASKLRADLREASAMLRMLAETGLPLGVEDRDDNLALAARLRDHARKLGDRT